MEELSPFTSKIGTSYTATREEAERITAFFAGPVSKLQRLQTEIVRVKACYDELVEQHLACPILLTRICSGWRHIALNTAMLRTSIHIPIPVCSLPERNGRPSTSSSPIHNAPEFEVTMKIARRQAIAIREWLGRSRECLLSISIYNDDYRTPEEVYTVILDALIFFRNRWGALKCETPAWGIMRVAAIPPSEFPRLHTLTFEVLSR